jgi:hypothetical protein
MFVSWNLTKVLPPGKSKVLTAALERRTADMAVNQTAAESQNVLQSEEVVRAFSWHLKSCKKILPEVSLPTAI